MVLARILQKTRGVLADKATGLVVDPFVDLTMTESTACAAISAGLLVSLAALSTPIENCCGHDYDGAASMSRYVFG